MLATKQGYLHRQKKKAELREEKERLKQEQQRQREQDAREEARRERTKEVAGTCRAGDEVCRARSTDAADSSAHRGAEDAPAERDLVRRQFIGNGMAINAEFGTTPIALPIPDF